MAELVIARVSDNGIQARDLSEAKSSKHNIALKAGNGSDITPVISFDGYNIGNTGAGLIAVNIDETGTVLASAVYDFRVAANITTFLTWMSTRTTGLVMFASNHTDNATSTDLTAKFVEWACNSWQYYWNPVDKSNTASFVGVYDVPLKKFMNYQFMDEGEYAGFAIQFDTFADIGVTGYGDPIAFDFDEHIQDTHSYEFWKYLPSTKITNLGLSVGETIEVYSELFQDSKLVSDGVETRLYIQFYNAGTWVTSSFWNITSKDRWESIRGEVKIPQCDEMMVGAYRHPSTLTSNTGVSGIRDLVIKAKKPGVIKTEPQQGGFGQWGFVTASADEKSLHPTVAESKPNQTLSAFRYGLLANETYGRLGGTGNYKIPTWYASDNYDITMQIMWDVGGGYMHSGQNGLFVVGAHNETTGEEGHYFWVNGVETKVLEPIRFGEVYTYKVSVRDLDVTFYLNDQQVGSGVMASNITKYDNFYFGNEGGPTAGSGLIPSRGVFGMIEQVKMDDLSVPNNTRHYSFILSGQPATGSVIKGRSVGSGLEYTVEAAPNAFSFYSGVGSNIAPYGMTAGDLCYVTILDKGDTTLETGIEVGERYMCDVGLGDDDLIEHSRILTPSGGSDWVTAGDPNTMKVRIEYVANPDTEAVPTNVMWITSMPRVPVFDGTGYIDLPTASTELDFSVKVIRTGTSTSDMYILEGRVGVNTTNGYITVKPNGTLSTKNENDHQGDFLIESVNGKPYVDGTVLELNQPYVIAGRVMRMARVGARFDGGLGFKGMIWDLTLEDSQTKDVRSWTGYVNTPFNSLSTCWQETLKPIEKVYEVIDVKQWNSNNNVSIPARNKWVFTQAGNQGMVSDVGLKTGDRFRVEYDITCSKETQLYCATSQATANLIKTLPAGRSTGYLSYQHNGIVAGGVGAGLYIRTANAIVGDYVQLNKLVVHRNVQDGIYNKTAAANPYVGYDLPNIKIHTKKLWCPNFGSGGYIDIPEWKPNKDNWRAHIVCKTIPSTESTNCILSGTDGSSTPKSMMSLDTYNTRNTIRFAWWNAAGVGSDLEIVHDLDQGELIDIVLDCSNRQLSLVVTHLATGRKWTSTAAYTGDGTESIKYIGYRPNGWKYTGDIHLVELIDTSWTLWSNRRYDLTLVRNTKPTRLTMQYDQQYMKTLRIGKGTNYMGWDNSVYPQIGYFKDRHEIDAHKLVYVKSTDLAMTKMAAKFAVGDENPFASMVCELWELKDAALDDERILLDSFDLLYDTTNKHYVSEARPSIANWFKDENAFKKIVFRPRGRGSNLVFTNFTTGQAWRETSR